MSERGKITIHFSNAYTHTAENQGECTELPENGRSVPKESKHHSSSFLKRLLLHFLTATVSACLLGGILGLTLLKMVETNTLLHQSQPGVKVDKLQYQNELEQVTLQEQPMWFVQLGVYTKLSSAKAFVSTLPAPLADAWIYKKNQKYYVLDQIYAVSSWKEEEVKKVYQALSFPIYVYKGMLSEKKVKGLADELLQQREGLLRLVDCMQHKKRLPKEELSRLTQIYSVSGGVPDKTYELFRKEMYTWLYEWNLEENHEPDEKKLKELCFLYYQWNENLDEHSQK